jgi:hypothetical protein
MLGNISQIYYTNISSDKTMKQSRDEQGIIQVFKQPTIVSIMPCTGIDALSCKASTKMEKVRCFPRFTETKSITTMQRQYYIQYQKSFIKEKHL